MFDLKILFLESKSDHLQKKPSGAEKNLNEKSDFFYIKTADENLFRDSLGAI